MARRISRRKHGELIIHQWWVNAILALILLAITAGFWLWARGWLAYGAGAISFGFFVNRATEAIRVNRQ